MPIHSSLSIDVSNIGRGYVSMSRRTLTYEEASEYVRSLGYELLTDGYIKDKQKIILKDNFGYLYVSILNNLKTGYSPRFAHKSNPYTIQNIKLWCKLNNKLFELVDGQIYTTSSVNLKWKCLKEGCGEIFASPWINISSQNRGCPFCHGRQVGLSNCLATKNPELASEWHPTLNGDLTPYDVTCGSMKKVWWQCKNHENHIWKSTINDRRLRGCPKCNESKGEKKITEILNNSVVYFIPQYIFKDCKYKNPLKFDFYIPYQNICIEFQGAQHYKPVKFFRGETHFKIQQTIDQIKRDYCNKNNIKLIEIPYWDFDKIEEILERELKINKKEEIK